MRANQDPWICEIVPRIIFAGGLCEFCSTSALAAPFVVDVDVVSSVFGSMFGTHNDVKIELKN